MYTHDNIRKSFAGMIMAAAMAVLVLLPALLNTAARGENDAGGRTGWIRGRELAWSPFSSVTNLLPRYHAIVIGINDYGRNPPIGWENLTTARQDAEAVADILEKQYKFNVVRLFDKAATRDAILEAMDNLVSCTVDDALLVYFAGHGFYDEKLGEGFWIPYDARQKAGQKLPREDWIWNSTLTKIFGASEARHILVIADSCYSGSLFRGGEIKNEKPDFTWYRRAMSRPSRYLITSGDLEPVLDSGTKHSIFAQNLLNCLTYPEKDIFSASELGIMVREKVSTMTGQMVRMGPLSVAANAGGEFVFMTPNAKLSDLAARGAGGAAGPTRGTETEAEAIKEPVKLDRQQVFRDAALLNDQGATNAAQNLLKVITANDPNDAFAKVIAAHCDNESRAKNRAELRAMIEKIEKRKAAAGETENDISAGHARPRILACIGPENPTGSADIESDAILSRICMNSTLQMKGGMTVVEREALQSVLQEMELGSSGLADNRARTAIGKLLPASVLLMGEILPQKNKANAYFFRLIDTETTKVLATFTDTADAGRDITVVCNDLADKIANRVSEVKPLSARMISADNTRIKAGVGSFHGAQAGDAYSVVQRVYAAGGAADEFVEKEIATAKLTGLGEFESELTSDRPVNTDPKTAKNIWVREKKQ